MVLSYPQVADRVKLLPSWFRQDIPDAKKTKGLKQLLGGARLHTVCESARCPNLGRCWGQGVATFMILGDVCTRACRFCAVKTGVPLAVDRNEPLAVARTIGKLGLKYVVITSVTRDDLADEGAGHFAWTVRETKRLNPGLKVEVLTPDFSARRELLKAVIDARPEVVGHNVETVRRLTGQVRAKADYERSLEVLKAYRELGQGVFVKSGFMVGLGETEQEIIALMEDLSEAGCDILTIGQYLSPTGMKRHLPVTRFVSPEEFDSYRRMGLQLGFKHVLSGPLVRSSYIADAGYQECLAKVSNGRSGKTEIFA